MNVQTLRFAGLIVTVTGLLVVLAACTSFGISRQAEAVSEITVANSWARSDIGGANSTAYMEIINGGQARDQLIGAHSDVAQSVEIHEVVADGQMMRMQEVESIEIPAGETASLEPGGLHVMLFGLQQELEVGDTFMLELRFVNAGTFEILVEVREHSGYGGHGS